MVTYFKALNKGIQYIMSGYSEPDQEGKSYVEKAHLLGAIIPVGNLQLLEVGSSLKGSPQPISESSQRREKPNGILVSFKLCFKVGKMIRNVLISDVLRP